MKLLMENWRRFLNERMEFGENFEKWLHGEKPSGEDVDSPKFGRGLARCGPADIDRTCLSAYGFHKIGEGAYRQVWKLPDNSDYVLKTATGLAAKSADTAGARRMNQAEADAIIQTGYPELLPKFYDRAKDYSWIVVEAVKPYPEDDVRLWIEEFFPIFAKFLVVNKENEEFKWDGDTPEEFFQNYTHARIDEIRKKDDEPIVLTYALGGPRKRKEFEENLPPLYHRLLEMIEHYNLAWWDIRSGNVGKASDGRFVVLDLGWGMND